MSDIHDHDDDHEHDFVPDEVVLEEHGRILGEQKLPLIEEAARKIGLYVDASQVTVLPTPFGAQAALVVDFLVGDIAFSKRVQDPDTDSFDRQFKELEVSMQDDEFLEARAQIQRNVAAGRHPLDDGEEEEV
jgi:hypothetical protein